MKHQIILLKIVTIILNIVCCKPDCKEGGTRYAEDLYKPDFTALFPYNGKQDLNFLKNGKDTITFYNLGFEDGYNYTYTDEDCTRKVPLQYKKIKFTDSLSGTSFELLNFINENFTTRFSLKLNEKVLFEDGTSGFILLWPPYTSIDIGKNHYDTLVYNYNKDGDYFYYKTYKMGMIKFKINNDVFELIP